MKAKYNIDQIIEMGESISVEFKSWIKAKDMKERIQIAVDELIAFANTKGGTIYFGIEDNGEVTGCAECDSQKIIETIYDKTRPPLFSEIEKIEYEGKIILAITVQCDGIIYATTDGRCLKRLGKNSKPYYPNEMSFRYSLDQNPDFSSQILTDSSEADVNLLELYNIKEKLRVRDVTSTLPDLDDKAFLRDLNFIKEERGIERLTVTGLLFIGKMTSISRLLPQAEVVYLHYNKENLEEYDARLDMRYPIITTLDKLTEKIQNSNKILNVQIGLFRLEIKDFSERVFQEALLNALVHRDYQKAGSVYVKHYPDRIMIENPGGFPEGITEKNIITHPSRPRNKLIAETLQRLKYVQRTGQGVDIIYKEMVSMGKPYPEYHEYNDAVTLIIESSVEDLSFVKFIVKEQDVQQRMLSLAEMMVLRYLSEHKRAMLSEVQELIQTSDGEARKYCRELIKMGLIEVVGREYMLTARVYEAIKPDIEYVQDQVVRYIKAKDRILDYLKNSEFITNEKIQELCGFTRQQARMTTDKMRSEELIELIGKGRGAKYKLKTHLNAFKRV